MSQENCCLPGVETQNCEDDNLLGCGCLKTQPFQLIAGVYQRGDILYKTGDGLPLGSKSTIPVVPGVEDADAFAIMPFNVEITAFTDSMAVWVAGEFNEDLVIGYDVLEIVKESLRAMGISLRSFG